MTDTVQCAYSAARLITVRRTLGGETVPGFAEDFAYDGAGNRTAWTVRDAAGAPRTTAYSADALNRSVLRESPGLVSVRGLADAAATVTVDGRPAARLGAYYFGTADVDGGEAGAWADVVTYAALPHGAADGDDLVAAVTNRVRVPPAHEIPAYDADGNPTRIRTATGDWAVEWDAESRPVRWTCGERTLLMAYDHLGRRVRLVETAGGATNRVATFVYDGYGCIARTAGGTTDRFVRDPSTGRPLAMVADGRAYLYAHDANGNVAALVEAETGEVAARYAYAAFGATLMSEGPLARRNPFRFSSEYADDETGLVYYNWRHYDPVHGVWLGRDPIGVDGGANLYAFCGNDPIGRTDRLGLLANPEDFFSSEKYPEQIAKYVDVTDDSFSLHGEYVEFVKVYFTARFTPPSPINVYPIGGGGTGALGGKNDLFDVGENGDLPSSIWGKPTEVVETGCGAGGFIKYRKYTYGKKRFRYGYLVYLKDVGERVFSLVEYNLDMYDSWWTETVKLKEMDMFYTMQRKECQEVKILYGDAGVDPEEKTFPRKEQK